MVGEIEMLLYKNALKISQNTTYEFRCSFISLIFCGPLQVIRYIFIKKLIKTYLFKPSYRYPFLKLNKKKN
jgi:hypothetical protein